MKKYLDKNISFILLIFLYIQPIIDIITSLCINYLHINFTFGMIIRFIFLLFILLFYLFIRKDNSKYKKIYLFSVLLFIVLFAIITIIFKDINALSYELTNIIKVFYFVILLSIIDKKDIRFKVSDLVKVACIYLILIAIPNIFNISLNSYTQGKVGSVGVFNSGNEISAILSILTPFLIYYLFNNNKLLYKIIIIILMGYTYFKIGSKIIIISLILSMFINLYLYFKNKKISKKNILVISVCLILFILIGIYILPKTNFYYNLKIHLEFLNINNFNDIFTFNFINRFIFSDRLSYLIDVNNIYFNSSFIEKLFGIGFIHNYMMDSLSLKLIEMDLFDIFYNIGIIGFIVYLFPIVINIKDVFKVKNNDIMLLIKFSIVLGVLISILVGHTLLAPGVSIYLVYLIKFRKE